MFLLPSHKIDTNYYKTAIGVTRAKVLQNCFNFTIKATPCDELEPYQKESYCCRFSFLLRTF
jgi:hypothetical protein